MQIRRKELISLGIHNPRDFWKELQQNDMNRENNITNIKQLEYAKKLYERGPNKNNPPIINSENKLFSSKNIKDGIKNLVMGKAQDIDGLHEK